MNGPYRAAWSMIGQTLVLDSRGNEAVRPPHEINHSTQDQLLEWERLVPIIVEALNKDFNKP
jgi:hypothetical protein